MVTNPKYLAFYIRLKGFKHFNLMMPIMAKLYERLKTVGTIQGTLRDMMDNVHHVLMLALRKKNKPAMFEPGAFGEEQAKVSERSGLGEGAGGGYKVTPAKHAQTAPSPFGQN